MQNHWTVCKRSVRKIPRPVDNFLLEESKTEKRHEHRFIPHRSCSRSCHKQFQSGTARAPLLASRSCLAPRWGLNSGDDADASVVHASVFILFPTHESGGWEGVGQEAAAAALCNFRGREKEVTMGANKSRERRQLKFSFTLKKRNTLSRYLPEKSKQKSFSLPMLPLFL